MGRSIISTGFIDGAPAAAGLNVALHDISPIDENRWRKSMPDKLMRAAIDRSGLGPPKCLAGSIDRMDDAKFSANAWLQGE
jgi:hypothetical protein